MVWEGNLDMSHNDTATGAIVNIYIHSSMCKIQTCVHTIQQGLSWNDDPHTERKKRKKNYARTGMNVSLLSKCLTRRTMLLHEELCLFWEVGFVSREKRSPLREVQQ